MSDPEYSIGSLRTTAADLMELRKRTDELIALRNRQMIYLYDGRKGRTGRELALAADMTEGRSFQILRAGAGAIPGTYNGKSAMFQIDQDLEILSAVVLTEDEDGFSLGDE
jgi:hypothetical protein